MDSAQIYICYEILQMVYR